MRSPKFFASLGFSYGVAMMITCNSHPEWNKFLIGSMGLIFCVVVAHFLTKVMVGDE